ncbi:MAG: DUF2284 domain-containing protein, partial [Desulfomonile tiedjei]|nr:DUF2284 domain-containing protein [Desulfomonile tiedjei]
MAKFLEKLADEAKELGATDAKLIEARSIVVDSRSFLKCRFGCGRWGKYWTCQPNIGMSVAQFQETLEKYRTAL